MRASGDDQSDNASSNATAAPAVLRDDGPVRTPAARRRASAARWLVVLAAAVLPTLGRFRNELVSDDRGILVESEVIHHPRNLGRVFTHRALFVSSSDADTPRRPPVDTYRPLTLTTFFVDAAISGRHPLSYHATNLALHTLCTLLLFALLQRLAPGAHPGWAVAGALFFALAPHGHEAHVWINGRSDPCCTAWILLALLARTGPRAHTRRALVTAGACTFAALLCKETAALVAPLLVWAPLVARPEPASPRSIAARWRDAWPAMASVGLALLAYVALRVFAVERGGVNPPPGMLAAVLAGTPWFYGLSLREALAPTDVCLRLLRDERIAAGPLAHAFGALCMALTLGLVARTRRSAPAVAWGLLFFALALAPSAVIPALRWIGFGRYLYLPTVGLAVALTAALARLDAASTRAQRLARVGLGVYLAVLGAQLVLAVPQWHDDEALALRAVSERPQSAIGYAYLAVVRETQQRHDEAIALYLRADELAPWDSSNLLRAAQWMLPRAPAGRALAAAVEGLRRNDSHAPEFHLVAARALRALGAREALIEAHLQTCGAVALSGGRCDIDALQPRRAP